MIVAIDGPAGAGKSTVARTVADRLGYAFVDTGAMYRAVALQAKRQNIDWHDEAGLGPVAEALVISFQFIDGTNHVFLDSEDVSEFIRAPDISLGASMVSAWPGVREGLLHKQRQLATAGDVVLEGRDIGTVVCPEAELKVFLDANLTVRARRRHRELRHQRRNDDDVSLENVLEQVKQRDIQDTTRAHAPLKPADDAIVLDSTKLSIEEVVETILALVRKNGS